MTTIVRHRLFWPAVVLVVLLVSNVFFSPRFFTITLQDGHLYGSLIDVLRSATPLALVALGMTMVIATGGIDLSVGSVMAVSGAVACLIIGDLSDQNSAGGVLMAVGVAIALALVLGIWNGVLVSVIGIQPIIATLILMVAGRGIAQLLTDGQIINVASAPFRVIGAGYALAIPVSVIIVAVVVAVSVLLIRRSALGVLVEAVGASPTASRLAGIRARGLTIGAYVFAAVCAAIAGLIFASNVRSADSNAAGNLIELDAILAVVLGGTSLAGGKFTLAGTVVGVFIIQTLTSTITFLGVPPAVTPVFKALVVIIVCLAQSRRVRHWLGGIRPARRTIVTDAAAAADRIPA